MERGGGALRGCGRWNGDSGVLRCGAYAVVVVGVESAAGGTKIDCGLRINVLAATAVVEGSTECPIVTGIRARCSVYGSVVFVSPPLRRNALAGLPLLLSLPQVHFAEFVFFPFYAPCLNDALADHFSPQFELLEPQLV